ncbi:MAG: sigma-54-dependent Fis family transcriptional regulator [Myxococcales bacterium]|nr:sigma-54-dependent Fis family transcriptional regulator [Myxococcales bacterium]MCB9552356.1 sigma-54-dependent Fis family transcriptional regulator [Myxococcales bacterium]
MQNADETTAADPTFSTATDGDEHERELTRPAVIVLTVLYHPDTRRIGERLITPWRPGGLVELYRLGPAFTRPDGADAGPLGDRGLSRRKLTLRMTAAGARFEPEGELPYTLGEREIGRELLVSAEALAAGLLLECGRRVLLWIETWPTPPAAQPLPGIDGISGAAERLRARIRALAPSEIPVMITGEPGTGKGRVAAALHARGRRAAGPWVALHAGALTPTNAAVELFGDTDRPGHFQQAEGGTLFLDDIAHLPEAVQPMLLRALDEDEAHGARVRLVTATDADIDALAADGGLYVPLLYRIRAARIDVPPLRARAADIPWLFVAFLRDRLAELGEAHRLAPTDDDPWLGRRVIEALLRHAWPGNLRELRNLAVEVALASAGRPHAALPAHFVPRPARTSPFAEPAALAREPARAESDPGHDDDRAWAVPPETLRDALRRHDWRVRPAADELGIARNTVYAMMGRLGIRRPGDLGAGDILAAARAEGSIEPARVARRLQISERGLKLRLRALNLTLE